MKEMNINATSVNTNIHDRVLYKKSMKELDMNMTNVSVKLYGRVT